MRDSVKIWLPALLCVGGLAQTFEVASVKPTSDPTPRKGVMRGGPGTDDPTLIAITNYPLSRLLLYTDQLPSDRLRCPDWMTSERYDITARVPEGATPEDARKMLRSLIVSRFQMVLHYQTVDRDVFDLVVAKGGPKMKAGHKSEPATRLVGPPQSSGFGPDGFPQYPEDVQRAWGVMTTAIRSRAKTTGLGQSMNKLAEALTNWWRHPVFDKTGLVGVYDFSFVWATDEAINDPNALPAPTIFAAVEKELGLRLEKRKEPTQVLVVEKAEKKPVEN